MQYSQHIKWLLEKQPEMLETLVNWAETNSGSLNLHGIKQMQTKIKNLYSNLGVTIHEYALTPSVLYLQQRPQAKYQVLLCGHCDTVFSETHPFQKVTQLDDNTLQGPGVTDMKGGLLVMYYALLALEQSPYKDQIGWQIFINADEEIGSIGSSTLLPAITENVDVAFVYEPAMDETGTLAGQRKGTGTFVINVKGKAAHVGRAFNEGRSAIVALANMITEIHALNNSDDIIINVGRISGGDALNMVPDSARCELNVRTTQIEDEENFTTALQRIFEKYNHDGITVVMQGQFNRKPKLLTPPMQALYQFVQTQAKLLNLHLAVKATGGCCDGNNLAALGIPNVDTLGVRGGNIHTSNEYIKIDSLVERAQLSALLLMSIANGELDVSK